MTTQADAADANIASPPLRIACLEPSATVICLALGLQDHMVGVTHECPAVLIKKHNVRVLTAHGLTVTSQGDIHQAVQQAAAAAKATCSRRGPTQISLSEEVPSLYPLLPQQLEAAQPTVIFTQDLCAVCAPTVADVQQVVEQQQHNNTDAGQQQQQQPHIVSLQPKTLAQVAETFVTVATACGIPQKGMALQAAWLQQFEQLKRAIQQARDDNFGMAGSSI